MNREVLDRKSLKQSMSMCVESGTQAALRGWPQVQYMTLWLHAWDSSLSAAGLLYVSSIPHINTHLTRHTHTTLIRLKLHVPVSLSSLLSTFSKTRELHITISFHIFCKIYLCVIFNGSDTIFTSFFGWPDQNPTLILILFTWYSVQCTLLNRTSKAFLKYLTAEWLCIKKIWPA